MNEHWLPIAGYEAKYAISTSGRVYSHHSNRVISPIRTGTNRRGAKRSKVRLSSAPRIDIDVAHLVLEHFVCSRPVGYVAMHADDDSSNNNISNLSWGTPSDNSKDAALKCRIHKQVLSAKDVANIKRRRSRGEKGRELAREYGVSEQRICDIYKGRTSLL